jgi:parallel beta-helix repeat protein
MEGTMRLVLSLSLLAAMGCKKMEGFDAVSCDSLGLESCTQVEAGDVEALLDAANSVTDGAAIILGEGTYLMDNQLTIRGADGVTLTGQGIDKTILNFADQAAQSNGIDVVGDSFTVQDLTVEDAKKDGIRVEDSDGVVIQRVKVTWTGGPKSTNGAYAIYPVKCRNVLIAESEAYNSSDAGIYVGQCINVIVRDNYAKNNVAGMEIENTQFADVYGNIAEENTAGLVAFDLPGNPVVGRDIKIHDNIIRNNNLANFAPGGTVQQIPAGTGSFAMASRRLEIYDNTYENNDTADLAIISGLAIEGNTDSWALSNDELVGETEDLGLMAGEGVVYNFRVEEIYVHGNSFSGSGTNADVLDLNLRPLGFLIGFVFGANGVDSILYDTIGESSFDANDPAGNSNDNHICIGENGGVSFASMDLETLASRLENNDIPTIDDMFRPPPPYTPFDCEGFSAGPIPEITLNSDS